MQCIVDSLGNGVYVRMDGYTLIAKLEVTVLHPGEKLCALSAKLETENYDAQNFIWVQNGPLTQAS